MANEWIANILIVEYPGYGLNFGKGITRANEIVRESKIVLRFLLEELKLISSDIIQFGFSCGTGVSVKLEKYFPEAPAAIIL
jgi:hypothetical protein